eukprot:4316277-Amphidinium_carterae.1
MDIFDFVLLPGPDGHTDPVRMLKAYEEWILTHPRTQMTYQIAKGLSERAHELRKEDLGRKVKPAANEILYGADGLPSSDARVKQPHTSESVFEIPLASNYSEIQSALEDLFTQSRRRTPAESG